MKKILLYAGFVLVAAGISLGLLIFNDEKKQKKVQDSNIGRQQIRPASPEPLPPQSDPNEAESIRNLKLR